MFQSIWFCLALASAGTILFAASPAPSAEIYCKLGILMSERIDSISARFHFERAITVSPGSQWALRAQQERSR